MRSASRDSLDDGEPICSVDPLTAQGRWCQFLGLAGFPLIPCLGLVIYEAFVLSQAVKTYQANLDNINMFQLNMDGLDVISAFNDEIAGVTSYIASDGKEIIDEMKQLYRFTDLKLDAFNHWDSEHFDQISRAKLYESLEAERAKVSNRSQSVLDAMTYYRNITAVFFSWMYALIDIDVDVSLSEDYMAYQSFLRCLDELLTVASLGTVTFLRGSLTKQESLMFSDAAVMSLANLENGETVDPSKTPELDEIGLTSDYLSFRGLYSTETGLNIPGISDLYTTVIWYRRVSFYFKGLVGIIRLEADDINEGMNKMMTTAQVNVIVSGVIICIIMIIVSPFLILAARHSIIGLYSYALTMKRKGSEIVREKRRTEQVLNEMLPKVIAHKLRKGEVIEAEYYEQVTVFFSDVVDFNEISATSSPIEIVLFLNEVYNFMDKLIERYDIYKVETIGCVYMVVSGLPSRNGNRHAIEIARMSLDLMEATESFVIPDLPHLKLHLRIGAHTGPVVAGVVGNKAPRFCLFGDTVNTASRIQTNGLSHHIHISGSMNDVLHDFGGFVTEERGIVSLKGKGSMTTYWLLSRHVVEKPASDASSFNIYDRCKERLINAHVYGESDSSTEVAVIP